ncbi:hypothetical protein [Sphingosinicella soli]|uniref:Cyclopropane fatty-acyl-phospholipid synthase-like methyltransferase n=1 Tax=Sphingosinicella soli TaxID=333708 RepID=A0A7W7F4R5_9SPHN|nr:hypothetical protein [Sphingosinicella soli]MBB4630635.1 cyclopropane fatty-acyl-phospholipid synthase-like methyltransferase [Sphingosinicella soli]
MPDSAKSGPLRQRLRAWWEGYDLAELKRRLAARVANEDAVPFPQPSLLERSQTVTLPHAEPTNWTRERLAAAQIVWGEGSLSPRGVSQLRAISARAGLGQRSRVLHLGAELGGVASELQASVGCTTLAAETQRPLADASNGRVRLLRAADGPLLPNADLILVDGLSEHGEPLTTLLRSQCQTLVPGGYVVVRSLVLTDERQASSPRYREWAQAEPVRPRLRSVETLSRLVEDTRLSVTAISDIAADYAAEVEYSWGGAIDRIRAMHRTPAGQALIPQLLAEGERWLKRIELIREGAIGVRVLIATRRDRARR